LTVELPRLVVCGECGGLFELSARNARMHRARGEDPVCRRCRHPAKPVDQKALERYRRWWLARFSLDELLELGRDLGWC
jgi:hypothetical protein